MSRSSVFIVFALLSSPACAQWERAGGPEGGNVISLEAKGDTVYAGTDGGVYISYDRGQSWKEIGQGLPDARTYGMSRDGGQLYVNSGGYVWYTLDDGAHWTKTAAAYSLGSALEARQGNLYSNSLGGTVAVSRDSGATWETPALPQTDLLVYAYAAEGNRVLAGTASGIFLSEDAGKTWKQTWRYPNAVRVYDLAIRGTHFLAGTEAGLFQSKDAGLTWEHTVLPGDEPLDFGYTIGSVAFAEREIFAGRMGGSILHSADTGKTWQIYHDSPGVQFWELNVLCPMGQALLAGTPHMGVMIHSGPGSVPVPSNRGLVAMEGEKIIAYGNALFLGTRSGSRHRPGLFKSVNGGKDWTPAQVPVLEDGNQVADLAEGSGRIYAFTYYKHFLVSEDTGRTWNELKTEPDFVGQSLVVLGDTIYAGYLNGDFRFSFDRGLTWGYPVSGYPGGPALAVLGSHVVTGSYNGMQLSKDRGKTWSGVFGVSGFIQSLGTLGPVLLAGRSDDLLISFDAGETWASYRQGIDNVPFPTPLTYLMADGVMLVGTTSGVFMRRLTDARWQPMSQGLRSLYVTGLAIQDGWLYAATLGGGVWKYPWNPNSTAVRGAAPDATRPRISRGLGKSWLDVEIASPGRYRIQLHGVDGKLLQSLQADFPEAGRRRVELQAKSYVGQVFAVLRKE